MNSVMEKSKSSVVFPPILKSKSTTNSAKGTVCGTANTNAVTHTDVAWHAHIDTALTKTTGTVTETETITAVEAELLNLKNSDANSKEFVTDNKDNNAIDTVVKNCKGDSNNGQSATTLPFLKKSVSNAQEIGTKKTVQELLNCDETDSIISNSPRVVIRDSNAVDLNDSNSISSETYTNTKDNFQRQNFFDNDFPGSRTAVDSPANRLDHSYSPTRELEYLKERKTINDRIVFDKNKHSDTFGRALLYTKWDVLKDRNHSIYNDNYVDLATDTVNRRKEWSNFDWNEVSSVGSNILSMTLSELLYLDEFQDHSFTEPRDYLEVHEPADGDPAKTKKINKHLQNDRHLSPPNTSFSYEKRDTVYDPKTRRELQKFMYQLKFRTLSDKSDYFNEFFMQRSSPTGFNFDYSIKSSIDENSTVFTALSQGSSSSDVDIVKQMSKAQTSDTTIVKEKTLRWRDSIAEFSGTEKMSNTTKTGAADKSNQPNLKTIAAASTPAVPEIPQEPKAKTKKVTNLMTFAAQKKILMTAQFIAEAITDDEWFDYMDDLLFDEMSASGSQGDFGWVPVVAESSSVKQSVKRSGTSKTLDSNVIVSDSLMNSALARAGEYKILSLTSSSTLNAFASQHNSLVQNDSVMGIGESSKVFKSKELKIPKAKLRAYIALGGGSTTSLNSNLGTMLDPIDDNSVASSQSSKSRFGFSESSESYQLINPLLMSKKKEEKPSLIPSMLPSDYRKNYQYLKMSSENKFSLTTSREVTMDFLSRYVASRNRLFEGKFDKKQKVETKKPEVDKLDAKERRLAIMRNELRLVRQERREMNIGCNINENGEVDIKGIDLKALTFLDLVMVLKKVDMKKFREDVLEKQIQKEKEEERLRRIELGLPEGEEEVQEEVVKAEESTDIDSTALENEELKLMAVNDVPHSTNDTTNNLELGRKPQRMRPKSAHELKRSKFFTLAQYQLAFYKPLNLKSVQSVSNASDVCRADSSALLNRSDYKNEIQADLKEKSHVLDSSINYHINKLFNNNISGASTSISSTAETVSNKEQNTNVVVSNTGSVIPIVKFDLDEHGNMNSIILRSQLPHITVHEHADELHDANSKRKAKRALPASNVMLSPESIAKFETLKKRYDQSAVNQFLPTVIDNQKHFAAVDDNLQKVGRRRSMIAYRNDGSAVEGVVSDLEQITHQINRTTITTESSRSVNYKSVKSNLNHIQNKHPVSSTYQQKLHKLKKISPEDMAREKIALKWIYEVCGGENWKRKDHWETFTAMKKKGRINKSKKFVETLSEKGIPVREWYGISTNAEGYVFEINLRNNNLKGKFPDMIGEFKHLEVLILDDNELYGPLPEYALMKNSNLQFLSLRNNKFSGEIPFAMIDNLTNLKELWLSNNKFTGEIQEEIGNFEKLSHLCLFKNKLSGNIPKGIGKLEKLEYLSIGDNQLSGEIPDLMMALQNLRELYIYNNKLTGKVPTWLKALPYLQNFEYYRNNFE